jgi:hypothetical protein
LVAIDTVGVGRGAWSWWSIGGDSSFPGFLQEEWRDGPTILCSNETPEGCPMSFVDVVKTLFVNIRDIDGVRDNITVQAKR